MKNAPILLIILFNILLSLNSCRKGPDDPFISFRSRTSRLTGRWKIAKGSEQFSYINSNSVSTTSISRDSFNTVTPNGSIPASTTGKSGTITLEYNFSKNGTYSYNRVETYAGNIDSSSGSGNWAFLSATGSLKNKEAILLTELNSYQSANGIIANNSYTSNNQGTVWVLTGLRNDYLIIDSQVSESSPNYSGEVIHYEFAKQ